MIDKDKLDSYFIFNDDGTLSWKEDRGGRAKRDNKAGFVGKGGYLYVKVDDKKYRIHRLVYFYHTGEWPRLIDHKDRDRKNNKFSNLRTATNQINSVNSEAVFNKHGYRGVQEHKGSYRANIKKNGKRYVSKVFQTPKQAHEEYRRMREELYPGVL